jgi:hypothetical protein
MNLRDRINWSIWEAVRDCVYNSTNHKVVEEIGTQNWSYVWTNTSQHTPYTNQSNTIAAKLD